MNQTRISSRFKQILLSVLGLALIACAMALLSAASLGITPVQSVSYVLHSRFSLHFSIGTLCFFWNMLLLALQILLLRSKFRVFDLLQIPLSLVFGFFVDAAEYLLVFVDPVSLVARCGVLLLGILVLAAGITFNVRARFIMNTGEAAVYAISTVSGKPFGAVKVLFDLSSVTLAVSVSFLLWGQWRLDIIGPATLLCSMLTGHFVKLYGIILDRLERSKQP